MTNTLSQNAHVQTLCVFSPRTQRHKTQHFVAFFIDWQYFQMLNYTHSLEFMLIAPWMIYTHCNNIWILTLRITIGDWLDNNEKSTRFHAMFPSTFLRRLTSQTMLQTYANASRLKPLDGNISQMESNISKDFQRVSFSYHTFFKFCNSERVKSS